MPKLYLIRHAEPTVTGVFHGCRNDVPLRDAAPTFDLPVEVVYVSPMRRARQTAANFTVPQIVLDELREIDFGEWGGLGWDEIEQRWPELTLGLRRNWFGVSPPGGESWADFTARVARVLHAVLADSRPKAIVAHGAVNAVAAGLLRGGDPSHFKQHYAQVSEFEV